MSSFCIFEFKPGISCLHAPTQGKPTKILEETLLWKNWLPKGITHCLVPFLQNK